MSNSSERFETELQSIIADFVRENFGRLSPEPNNSPRTPHAAGGGAARTPFTYGYRSNPMPTISPITYNRERAQQDEAYLFTIRDIMRGFNANIQTYQANMHDYILNVYHFLNIIQSMIHAERQSSQPVPRAPYTSPNIPPINTRPIPQPTRAPPRTIYQNLSYLLFPNIDVSGTFFPAHHRFQDVIVRPTRDEIERATELMEYRPLMELSNLNCPITLEEFQEGDLLRRIRYCGHTFKSQSLDDWFTMNVRCPICRYDIRTYRPSRSVYTPAPTHNIRTSDDDENDTVVEDEEATVVEDDDSLPSLINLSNNTEDGSDEEEEETTTIHPTTTRNVRNDSVLLSDDFHSLFRSLSGGISNSLSALTSQLDISNGLIYRLEIPIDYEEEYDSSSNLISRRIIGFPR
jgi:hypothetical protein